MKVSICMITYGHENYIVQAIEGVLMQECDFDLELIIANDCSKDDTDEKIQSIIYNHPRASIIKYIKHEYNIGMIPNFIHALQNCKGKYIALCEGDDYWTDPLKLQQQVMFLEENLDCTFCFHNAKKVNDANLEIGLYKFNFLNNKISAQDFFKVPTIPTASVVFRKNIQIPEIIHSHGDFVLYCTFLSHGLAGYIDKKMSVYRLHDNGVSSQYNSKKYLGNRINELGQERKSTFFSKEVRIEINKITLKHILLMMNMYWKELLFIEKT
jgi:glycosyltransferase involved in cell wall biosynthesis